MFYFMNIQYYNISLIIFNNIINILSVRVYNEEGKLKINYKNFKTKKIYYKVDKKKLLLKCECGETTFKHDEYHDEVFCPVCGFVIQTNNLFHQIEFVQN